MHAGTLPSCARCLTAIPARSAASPRSAAQPSAASSNALAMTLGHCCFCADRNARLACGFACERQGRPTCRDMSSAPGSRVRGRPRCLGITRILHASCGPRNRRFSRSVWGCVGPDRSRVSLSAFLDHSPASRGGGERLLSLQDVRGEVMSLLVLVCESGGIPAATPVRGWSSAPGASTRA
jgi:hypothetical protein